MTVPMRFTGLYCCGPGFGTPPVLGFGIRSRTQTGLPDCFFFKAVAVLVLLIGTKTLDRKARGRR